MKRSFGDEHVRLRQHGRRQDQRVGPSEGCQRSDPGRFTHDDKGRIDDDHPVKVAQEALRVGTAAAPPWYGLTRIS